MNRATKSQKLGEAPCPNKPRASCLLGMLLRMSRVKLLLADPILRGLSCGYPVLELYHSQSLLQDSNALTNALTMKSSSPKVRSLVSNMRKYPQTNVNVASTAQKNAYEVLLACSAPQRPQPTVLPFAFQAPGARSFGWMRPPQMMLPT